ncbi:MAG: YicC family protein [Planctomycetaceae bacterium]
MLFSMTGYGEAHRQTEDISLTVEVRSVNNRYLKIATKLPDGLSKLESEIEKVVREFISRGAVTVVFRVDRLKFSEQYFLDHDVLKHYWEQLHSLSEAIHVAGPVDMGSLLQLPGAIRERSPDFSDDQLDKSLIRDLLREAMESLQEFRKTEGESMCGDLSEQCRTIRSHLELVEGRVPDVVTGYRDRLLDRVRELIEGMDVEIQSQDLIREVSIFAERCDINEEITRLRSHLNQFETFLHEESSQGRKLEFLGQEMNREINTIGSKANDISIAHHVVEMKGSLEKIREILQNVE